MKSEYILGKIRYSREVIKLISHLRMFDRSEVDKERQKIISFYDIYGEKATYHRNKGNRYTAILINIDKLDPRQSNKKQSVFSPEARHQVYAKLNKSQLKDND